MQQNLERHRSAACGSAAFCRMGLVRSQPNRALLFGNGLWFKQSEVFAGGRQHPAPSSLHAPGGCSSPADHSPTRSRWQLQDMKEHDLRRGAMLLVSSLLRLINIYEI